MNDRIDPQRTALLVIDMQRNAIDGTDERALLVRESGIAERLAEVVKAARARDMLIVYVMATRSPDGKDQVRLPTQNGLSPVGRPAQDSPDWQVTDVLRPEPQDYVVPKRRRNAFH